MTFLSPFQRKELKSSGRFLWRQLKLTGKLIVLAYALMFAALWIWGHTS